MTTYSRIINSTAAEIIDFNPVGRFHPDVAALFVEVPDGTGQNDTRNQGGTWTKYVPPVVIPTPPAPIRIISKLEYMNRFTDAELAAIYTAAKSVISVEIWLEKFKLASEIDLDDPRTIGGVRAMEAAGLLATGRAAVILA